MKFQKFLGIRKACSPYLTVLIILIPFLTAGYSQQGSVGLNPDASRKTEELGRLIGTWYADQTIINRDGSWSSDTTHALWKWYYILDGHAIQDDWIMIDSLGMEHPTGTNIRIYNAEEKKWYMAWIDKTNRMLASFTAINDNGKIIMDGTNAKGRHIKNIFYNIKENDFDWKQEWTFDEGNSWVEVARIHCTRKILNN